MPSRWPRRTARLLASPPQPRRSRRLKLLLRPRERGGYRASGGRPEPKTPFRHLRRSTRPHPCRQRTQLRQRTHLRPPRQIRSPTEPRQQPQLRRPPQVRRQPQIGPPLQLPPQLQLRQPLQIQPELQLRPRPQPRPPPPQLRPQPGTYARPQPRSQPRLPPVHPSGAPAATLSSLFRNLPPRRRHSSGKRADPRHPIIARGDRGRSRPALEASRPWKPQRLIRPTRPTRPGHRPGRAGWHGCAADSPRPAPA